MKAIAFNEYLDTQVDEKIIAESSLNDKFINEYLSCSVSVLDDYIGNYRFDAEEIKQKMWKELKENGAFLHRTM